MEGPSDQNLTGLMGFSLSIEVWVGWRCLRVMKPLHFPEDPTHPMEVDPTQSYSEDAKTLTWQP